MIDFIAYLGFLKCPNAQLLFHHLRAQSDIMELEQDIYKTISSGELCKLSDEILLELIDYIILITDEPIEHNLHLLIHYINLIIKNREK